MGKFKKLYIGSVQEARENGEILLWRENMVESIRCKDAMEDAIQRYADGTYLRENCARSVIEMFGFQRVRLILAYTMQKKSWYKAFRLDQRLWRRFGTLPKDAAQSYLLTISASPFLVQAFVEQYKRECASLGLFTQRNMENQSWNVDYADRVLAIRADVLDEEYWKPEYQLWYAHDGTGCDPAFPHQPIRCTCLGDGTSALWDRDVFLGPVREECLPEWAVEKRKEYQRQEDLSPMLEKIS